jgi:hypothetical protein
MMSDDTGDEGKAADTLPPTIVLKVGAPLNGYAGRNMQIVGEEQIIAVKTKGEWRDPKPGATLGDAVNWLLARGYQPPTGRNAGRDDRLGMAVRELTYKRRGVVQCPSKE